MNCEESKNLIVEMTDADEVGSNAELSAHLAVCSNCRQFFKYELKMRDGFADIASEPVPAEVARKILAVPRIVAAENAAVAPGWVKKLSAFINSMTFKVALASGITGFAAAIIFFRGFSPVAEQKLERPLFSRGRELQPPASATSITAAGAAVTMNPELKKMAVGIPGRPEIADDLLALKAQKDAGLAAERRTVSSEHIPGAVSFSLDKNYDNSGQFAMAPAAPAAPAPDAGAADADAPTFAEAEQAVSEVDAGGQKAMMMASAPKMKEVMRGLPASSKADGIAKNELANSFAEAEVEAKTDPRASAILKCLESNGLASEEGFVDLDELFMKGYIDNSQLREWRAPDGNAWYLSHAGNRPGIMLRRKP